MTQGYRYKSCGLDYVYLVNGYKVHETRHGKGVSIVNPKGLHEAIARTVVASLPRLRGQEVRFLRAQLGLSQTGLARVLGVERGTVARWEGRPSDPIPGAAATALRLFFAYKADGHALADKIVGLLTELDELEHGAPKATSFRAKADRWDRSLAA